MARGAAGGVIRVGGAGGGMGEKRPLGMGKDDGVERVGWGGVRMPVTFLSGFLGAGKTTVLKHALGNVEGLKLGLVVNDMAGVNVDAKESRSSAAAAGAELVELQNGCACCSAADGLLDSFAALVRLCDARGAAFDRIVVECSGVAEPRKLVDSFLASEDDPSADPVYRRLKLDTLVTVVDAAVFVRDFSARDVMEASECATRRVVDLLVEQVEVADVLVLNKTDQLKRADQLDKLEAVVRSLNATAAIVPTTWGRVPIATVLGADLPLNAQRAARINVETAHKRAVSRARVEADLGAPEGHVPHGHVHGPDCGEACGHSNGHGHGHGHDHDHHGRDGGAEAIRSVDGGGQGLTTAASRFGITSFVYSRRRPFHPARLAKEVIKKLQVESHSSVRALFRADEPDAPTSDAEFFHRGAEEAGQGQGQGASALGNVVRSKGYVWLANSHLASRYWSHAGIHFELRDSGAWWSTVPADEWPSDPEQRHLIASDFAPEDAKTKRVGDRRQEIVFIGPGLNRPRIEGLLDACLLTDAELATYNASWKAHMPDVTGAEDVLGAEEEEEPREAL